MVSPLSVIIHINSKEFFIYDGSKSKDVLRKVRRVFEYTEQPNQGRMFSLKKLFRLSAGPEGVGCVDNSLFIVTSILYVFYVCLVLVFKV